MATAKKKYPHAIYYNDGSYMIYELTQDDFETLKDTMVHEAPVTVELSIGLISIKDIRSVIKQKPPEKPKKTESAVPDLTAEELEWMAINKSSWKVSDFEGGYGQ